jgi:hypothetical protein
MRGQSPLARFCAAAYRVLLHLYPPRFRREYGAEMAQLFADLSRDADQRNGTTGVLALFVRAVFDTLQNSIGEWLTIMRKHWGKTLLTLTGLAALGGVWLFMFLWMIVYSSIFLVPWDATFTRPPEGTLAQLANDFFDGPGMSILSFVVLAVNATLFARAVRAGAETTTLPWKFAIAGVVFVAGSFALVTLGIQLGAFVWPFPVGRSDPGFHRSLFPGLMCLVSFVLYLKLLSRFARQGRLSHDNLTLDGAIPYKTTSENGR